MRWTCLLFGLMLTTLLPAQAGSSPPKVTLRIHVQVAGEGLSPQEATTIAVPPDGEEIQVRTLPEASERDLVEVQQDATGLHLQFNHVGTVNLNAVTAENQGRILVVMVDGRIIYAPVIDAQISKGHLDIPHQIPPQLVVLLQQLAQQNVRQAEKS
jgi:preprotein translocase subunit SecD